MPGTDGLLAASRALSEGRAPAIEVAPDAAAFIDAEALRDEMLRAEGILQSELEPAERIAVSLERDPEDEDAPPSLVLHVWTSMGIEAFRAARKRAYRKLDRAGCERLCLHLAIVKASPEKQEAADAAITDHFYPLLRAVFDLAAGEVFEDGMETAFSEALIECLEAGGPSVVHALRKLLDQGYAGPEVGGEALRWLGCVSQPGTRDVRRLALEHYLRSDSVYLRDGAAIGLSEIDDPAALPAIESAISNEANPLMLKLFKLLREQLEATKRCRTSPE